MFFLSVSFSLLQRMGQPKTPQSSKACSVEKHNCCLCIKLSSRNSIFCSLIAFPPSLAQAKRSLLRLQPGNGRQALGCSWLSVSFCFCWTHGDTPLFSSKVLKAICFRLRPDEAVLSYQHARWGVLLLSVLLQLRCSKSLGSHRNVRCLWKSLTSVVPTICYRASNLAGWATATPSSEPYWALSEPRGCTDQLARLVLQFVMLL